MEAKTNDNLAKQFAALRTFWLETSFSLECLLNIDYYLSKSRPEVIIEEQTSPVLQWISFLKRHI